MAHESKIVVVNVETGTIEAVQCYDATAADRDAERSLVMSEIGAKLGLRHPDVLRNRGVEIDGHEWGIMHADVEVGMVEISLGKWGFAK